MRFSVRNNIATKALRVISGAFVFFAVAASSPDAVAAGNTGHKVKVACVGNSITYGLTLADPAQQSYPSLLQKSLGEGYEVRNFGHSGATLLEKGHNPYRKTQDCAASLEFAPDLVVIHLGINDTDPRNWPEHGDEFVKDYLNLIAAYREVNPDVRIIIARLTPITARHYRFRSGTRDWRLQIQDAIEQVAKAANVELIDFDEPLRDHEDYFHDAVHPNQKGAEILAETVYSGITGDYGGLKMPAIYSDSMVLQHHRPLRLSGMADAGKRVSLTLDSHTYRAVTDNRGRWSVVTAPLTTGGPYTMTVSDGDSTITISDILAGEVWLASGQSNMEFELRGAEGGAVAAARSYDPYLRYYNMRRKFDTYHVEWDSAQLASADRFDCYKPARWSEANMQTSPDMSAVGYFFAKMLSDSLNVPVGIISNAVGGTTTESWIDMLTLERDIPELTVNWLTNDYVQKWAQGRAAYNMGGKDTGHRHPFEPGYMYAAGIRPLGSYPIEGVIWYQGESNAHNIEVHEQLFTSLVDSWRREFGNEDMPFYFVQLSSINRPSWPGFRDSQRRLADRLPGVAMVVSSDVGNETDVHPVRKRQVGERLARLALHDTYGRDVTCSGPTPVEAESRGGAIYLKFDNAYGLHTSTGGELLSFEVAEYDGDYRHAKAEILHDNTIKVYSMEISRPRYVRYGWQPYSTGNLVNNDDLPASTFKMEVGNLEMFEPEAGIEYGVSAAYAAVSGDSVVVVGGCNFPTSDPLAPGAAKRFYKGIYTGRPVGDDFQWRLLGALPEAKAYGGAVAVEGGILLIGGTGDDGKALDTVEMVALPSLDTTPMPALPATIDNMAVCKSGRKVYVAGGNYNGEPSRRLLVLDLDNLNAGWTSLTPFPGNPRVQPVMAADAKGNIYLWGGFAGKGPGREASLDTEGLMYNVKTGRWTEVAGPRDSDGEAVSLGGGAMTMLPDGRFAVIGGVNKDVFIEALRNQAPDYLLHSTEWYRFNPTLYIFNPKNGKWTAGPSDSELARAGASFVALPDGRLVVYGGELKPRIRSNQTTLLGGSF